MKNISCHIKGHLFILVFSEILSFNQAEILKYSTHFIVECGIRVKAGSRCDHVIVLSTK